MSTEDIMSEQLEECESLRRVAEPDHDDEPMLAFPRQDRPLILPPAQPLKFEPALALLVDEPEAEEPDEDAKPTPSEPQKHYLSVEAVNRTHEISIQCSNPEEESKEHLLATVEEASDEDNFSVHSCDGTLNRVTVGIQTNEAHFRRIERTAEFARRRQERLESTDWALSPIFDEIVFAKEKRSIGGRK